MSPEVQEILQKQDAQLKALQRQIQKLLRAQEERTPCTPASAQQTDYEGVDPQLCTSVTTQTVNARSATGVNTGVSLLGNNFNYEVSQPPNLAYCAHTYYNRQCICSLYFSRKVLNRRLYVMFSK